MGRAAKAWAAVLAPCALLVAGTVLLPSSAATAAAARSFLVTFRPAVVPASSPAALAAAVAALDASPAVNAAPLGAGVARVRTTLTASQLAAQPGVASVEPERNWTPAAATPPTPAFGTEPGDALEWALHNGGGRDLSGWPTTAGADVDAPDAWTVSTGAGVVVAIADTGVDLAHPDLAPNVRVAAGEDCAGKVDGDGNSYVADCHGWDFGENDNDPSPVATGADRAHGTHDAGLVAAARDGVGAGGVAPDARILALKVTSATGAIVTSAAVASIVYAADNGALVYEASWGAMNARSAAMEAAVRYAASKGMLIVAAAGNNGVSLSSRDKFYPASFAEIYDNVVSVAATTQTDLLASFSNRDAVTLAAPGTWLWSTMPGGGWGLVSGTSSAAAVTAGAAALVFAAHPSWTPAQVKAQLVASADHPAALAGAGAGRLDAARAVGATVTARSPVAAPAHVSAQPRARATTVAWTLAATDEVASIDVLAIAPAGAVAGTATVGPTATTATVASLQPSTPYTIVVRTVDTAGRVVASATTVTTTAPLPPPVDVRAVGTATDVVVQFSRPTAPGWGTVARYRAAVGSQVRLVAANGASFFLPFGPYTAGTDVSGTVTSIAANGDESTPVPFAFTTADASPAPVASVGAGFGSLVVTVQPLEAYVGHPAVTGFVVRAGTWSRTVPVGRGAVSTTFSGVTGAVAVSVQAVHATRAGTFAGATNDLGSFTPLAVGPPPAPTGLAVTQSPGRIGVAWDAGGATVTGFEVQLDTGASARVATDQPSFSFANPGRTGTHRVTVRSVNPFGKTAATTTFTIDATAPRPVVAVVVTIGAANTTATWSVPSDSWATSFEVRVDSGPVLTVGATHLSFATPAAGAHAITIAALNPFGRSALVVTPFTRT